jgi:hypothetical protein
VTITFIWKGDHIKKDDFDSLFDMHGRDHTCIQNIGWKNCMQFTLDSSWPKHEADHSPSSIAEV